MYSLPENFYGYSLRKTFIRLLNYKFLSCLKAPALTNIPLKEFIGPKWGYRLLERRSNKFFQRYIWNSTSGGFEYVRRSIIR